MSNRAYGRTKEQKRENQQRYKKNTKSKKKAKQLQISSQAVSDNANEVLEEPEKKYSNGAKMHYEDRDNKVELNQKQTTA